MIDVQLKDYKRMAWSRYPDTTISKINKKNEYIMKNSKITEDSILSEKVLGLCCGDFPGW